MSIEKKSQHKCMGYISCHFSPPVSGCEPVASDDNDGGDKAYSPTTPSLLFSSYTPLEDYMQCLKDAMAIKPSLLRYPVQCYRDEVLTARLTLFKILHIQ